MKKKAALCLVLLICLFALLCACSSYSGIRGAFEGKGYEVAETEEYEPLIGELIGEGRENVSIHVFRKNSSFAVIAEFASDEELEDAVKENEALAALAPDVKRSDLVSGNCMLIAYTPLSDVPTIFKDTK